MDMRAAYCVAVAVAMMASPVAGQDGGWDDAHATFYGDMSGGETMQGACGYGNLIEQGYGLETAALSAALFNDGLLCGACFQIRCHDNPQYCVPGADIIVTATNFCPANYSKPSDNWCNPPLKHFDLSMPMFVKLVKDYHVGIIPVQYRRVPCVKKGGIRFELKGNQYLVLVLVFNVAGAGDVRAVSVKGSRDGQWTDMSRNWGQNWNGDGGLVGQGISFRITASDGRGVVLEDAVPPNWSFGQSFEGKGQF